MVERLRLSLIRGVSVSMRAAPALTSTFVETVGNCILKSMRRISRGSNSTSLATTSTKPSVMIRRAMRMWETAPCVSSVVSRLVPDCQTSLAKNGGVPLSRIRLRRFQVAQQVRHLINAHLFVQVFGHGRKIRHADLFDI